MDPSSSGAVLKLQYPHRFAQKGTCTYNPRASASGALSVRSEASGSSESSVEREVDGPEPGSSFERGVGGPEPGRPCEREVGVPEPGRPCLRPPPVKGVLMAPATTTGSGDKPPEPLPRRPS